MSEVGIIYHNLSQNVRIGAYAALLHTNVDRNVINFLNFRKRIADNDDEYDPNCVIKLRFKQQKICPDLFIEMLLSKISEIARADQEKENLIVDEIKQLWTKSDITIDNYDTLIKKLNSIIKDLTNVDDTNKKEIDMTRDEIDVNRNEINKYL